jgi:hypothetical protein
VHAILADVDDYTSPLKRKAERPQRTGDHPYVIGIAAVIYQPRIPDFKDWPHVSAVVPITPFFGVKHYHWRASIIKNPNANRPIPATFLRQLPTGTHVNVDPLF